MDAIAATSVLRPQPTRIAPVFDEERTAPATVAATSGEDKPPQNPKFSDVVAILNPLQNLPIVGTIYRQLTNDVPHPAARALGGLLWGGPLGLVGAIFSYVAEQVSGKSTTEIVKGIFEGDRGGAQALAEQPAATAGTPRSLLPASTTTAAEEVAPTAGPAIAQATPRGPAPAAQPQSGGTLAPAVSELRPRNAATRDLAFYQAHAGSRLPPASSAAAPSGGPQAGTQPAAFHRAVAPVLGSEPVGTGAVTTATPPVTRVDTAASAPVAAAAAPPVSPQDFLQRMMRGIDQYQAINRSLDAQSRSTRLDRVE